MRKNQTINLNHLLSKPLSCQIEVEDIVGWKIGANRRPKNITECMMKSGIDAQCRPISTTTVHGASGTDFAKGREEVGQSRDATLCSFGQYQRNRSNINGGLGCDHVSGGSAARSVQCPW